MSSGAAGRHPGLARSRHQQHPVPAAESRQHLNSCAPGRRGTGRRPVPSLAHVLGSQPGQPGAGPALPSSGPARTLGPAHLSSVCSAGVPSLPLHGLQLPHLCQNSPPQLRARCWPWGPLAPAALHRHLPQLAGARAGTRRRTGSHAGPHGMLFPTVSLWGVCREPLPRAGPCVTSPSAAGPCLQWSSPSTSLFLSVAWRGRTSSGCLDSAKSCPAARDGDTAPRMPALE